MQSLKYQIYTKFTIHVSDLGAKLTFGVSNTAQPNRVAIVICRYLHLN